MAALLLCGLSGAAVAQTSAQRLAAWSQAIMLRRIEAAQKAEASEELKAQLQETEQLKRANLESAPEPINRQTRSRGRWLALEKAAGPQ